MAEIGLGAIGITSTPLNLEVAEADIDDIVLRIDNGLSITGHIRVSGDAKGVLQNVSVKFRVGGPRTDFSRGASVPVAKDGTFRNDNNAPGLYGVLVSGLPDGFYTKSIRAADKEMIYTGIDLTSGTSTPLEIVVSPKAVLVSGLVQDEKTGKSVRGATVVMVPQERNVSGFPPSIRKPVQTSRGASLSKVFLPANTRSKHGRMLNPPPGWTPTSSVGSRTKEKLSRLRRVQRPTSA